MRVSQGKWTHPCCQPIQEKGGYYSILLWFMKDPEMKKIHPSDLSPKKAGQGIKERKGAREKGRRREIGEKEDKRKGERSVLADSQDALDVSFYPMSLMPEYHNLVSVHNRVNLINWISRLFCRVLNVTIFIISLFPSLSSFLSLSPWISIFLPSLLIFFSNQ